MKIILTILFLGVVFCQPCFGLDWKDLHEEADQISIEKAKETFNRKGPSEETFYLLGLVYLNEYMTKEARAAFEEMIKINPESVEGKWGIAETLRRDHKMKESTDILVGLIEENPKYSPAIITLAYVKYIQGDWNESVRLNGLVINQRKDHVDFSNFLRAHGLYGAAKGMIAHYGGPISKAVNGAAVLKHLDIIQKLAPDSSVVNFGLGSYYMLIPKVFGQDLDKAKTYLQKAIETDPKFPNPYVRLAQIYKREGNQEIYNELMSKALELDPKNELALDIKSGKCLFVCLEEGDQ